MSAGPYPPAPYFLSSGVGQKVVEHPGQLFRAQVTVRFVRVVPAFVVVVVVDHRKIARTDGVAVEPVLARQIVAEGDAVAG